MTTIRLYWNNICVLHRQELQFLNEIRHFSLWGSAHSTQNRQAGRASCRQWSCLL